MLKSYNKVLEKQTKKMTQTEKLMEKFNSQNASILNKIHKKSISWFFIYSFYFVNQYLLWSSNSF